MTNIPYFPYDTPTCLNLGSYMGATLVFSNFFC